MVETVLQPGPVGDVSSWRDAYCKAFRLMLLARVLDDKFASLYRAAKIHGGVFLGRGQEALSVAAGLALREGDIFAPLIRDQAGRLAFGEPILDAVRSYLGSALTDARSRRQHPSRPAQGRVAGDDQSFGCDDLGREWRIVRTPHEGHRGNCGGDVHWRWRYFHRRVSRGGQSGRGRKTAAGCDRGGQPIRVLYADRASVRLPFAH